MSDITEIRQIFAPTGTLRASINIGNPVLAKQNNPGEAPYGVSIDIAHALDYALAQQAHSFFCQRTNAMTEYFLFGYLTHGIGATFAPDGDHFMHQWVVQRNAWVRGLVAIPTRTRLLSVTPRFAQAVCED